MSVQFAYTNESLDAVMSGLCIGPSDDLIALGGPGCQAFAAAQYANSVLYIERRERQAEYAMKRAEALKAGDYDGFFPEIEESTLSIEKHRKVEKHRKAAKEYFSRNTLLGKIFKSRTRLGKIRGRLGRIEFRVGRIEDFVREMQGGRFSKAYLSNLFTYSLLHGGQLGQKHNQRDFMQMLAAKLRKPGLIYITDGHEVNIKYLYNADEDKELTDIARKLESGWSNDWQPSVFRKRV